jgi:hypothetical protein
VAKSIGGDAGDETADLAVDKPPLKKCCWMVLDGKPVDRLRLGFAAGVVLLMVRTPPKVVDDSDGFGDEESLVVLRVFGTQCKAVCVVVRVVEWCVDHCVNIWDIRRGFVRTVEPELKLGVKLCDVSTQGGAWVREFPPSCNCRMVALTGSQRLAEFGVETLQKLAGFDKLLVEPLVIEKAGGADEALDGEEELHGGGRS